MFIRTASRQLELPCSTVHKVLQNFNHVNKSCQLIARRLWIPCYASLWTCEILNNRPCTENLMQCTAAQKHEGNWNRFKSNRDIASQNTKVFLTCFFTTPKLVMAWIMSAVGSVPEQIKLSDRRSQGGLGSHAPQFLEHIVHFVLWEAVSQTKYC